MCSINKSEVLQHHPAQHGCLTDWSCRPFKSLCWEVWTSCPVLCLGGIIGTCERKLKLKRHLWYYSNNISLFPPRQLYFQGNPQWTRGLAGFRFVCPAQGRPTYPVLRIQQSHPHRWAPVDYTAGKRCWIMTASQGRHRLTRQMSTNR